MTSSWPYVLYFAKMSVFFSFLISVPAKPAGTDVGNGGDAVICSNEGGDATPHFLDELIALLDPVWTLVPSDAKTRKAIETQFSRILLGSNNHDEKAFVADFIDAYSAGFVQIQKAQPNSLGNHIWNKGLLPKISDEAVEVTLPQNCLLPNGNANTVQLVVQTFVKGQNFYSYNAELMTPLGKNQRTLSMIILHEFLWRYSSSARVVREANAFFHSSEFLTMAPQDVHLTMISLGIFLPKADL